MLCVVTKYGLDDSDNDMGAVISESEMEMYMSMGYHVDFVPEPGTSSPTPEPEPSKKIRKREKKSKGARFTEAGSKKEVKKTLTIATGPGMDDTMGGMVISDNEIEEYIAMGYDVDFVSDPSNSLTPESEQTKRKQRSKRKKNCEETDVSGGEPNVRRKARKPA